MTTLAEALRINPKFALALVNRGRVNLTTGAADRAMADFNEAIQIDPQLALGYFNRGVMFHERKEFDLAIADYNESIRLNPTESDRIRPLKGGWHLCALSVRR